MKKAAVIWLVAGFLLVFTGAVVFITSLALANGNFRAIFNSDYRTNALDIKKSFSNIKVNADTEDISFALSQDGKCKVVFFEDRSQKHTAKVIDNTLTIESENKKGWYDYISLFPFDSKKITVYLPENSYNSVLIKGSTGDINLPKDFTFGIIDIEESTGEVNCCSSASGALNIKTGTGGIKVKDVSAKDVNLAVSTGMIEAKGITCTGETNITVSTGDAEIKDFSCGGFNSSGSTGDITLNNVICSGKMTVSRSTGDVLLRKSDASEITVKTSTGDVTGTLISGKVFITNTNTGDVDVPETVTGGKCKITTDTGDITIKLK